MGPNMYTILTIRSSRGELHVTLTDDFFAFIMSQTEQETLGQAQ